MRPRALLAPLLLTAAIVVPLPSASAGDPPTCEGRTATIVGRSGVRTLHGTPGPDVIVTRGATTVRAGRGSDLICVTGPGRDVFVGAGEGDDLIVVRAERADVRAVLGEGADRFVGGPGDDFVREGSLKGEPSGADVIRTGGGDDNVSLQVGAERARDRVDLGAGDDLVLLPGRSAQGVVVTGGSGTDEMYFGGDATGAVIDNRAGTATFDDGVRWRWRSFESFRTLDMTRTVFHGGPASESISLGDFAEATMGAGDDFVVGACCGTALVRMDGGPGRDLFTWGASARLDIDLAGGTLLADDHPGPVPVTGFEDVRAASAQLQVTGTPGGNEITFFGCRLEVQSGEGDDTVVRKDPLSPATECADASRIDVGPGNDVVRMGTTIAADLLLGGPGDDLLDGGAGADEAEGGDGVDTCLAEVVRTCER